MKVASNTLETQQTSNKLQQGLTLHKIGQLQQAKEIYEDILKSTPGNFDVLQSLGILFAQEKQFNKALELLIHASKINNSNSSVFNNIGNILRELNRFEDALTYIDKAIFLKNEYSAAYLNRGVVLEKLNRFHEALESYDKAIELDAGYFLAYYNRGNLLKRLELLEAALANYDKAIHLNSNFAEAYSNRSVLLKELNLLEESLASCDIAIKLNSDFAEAYNIRGTVLEGLNRWKEALSSYDTAIKLNSNLDLAYNNRGNLLKKLNRPEEALADYDKAISLNSKFAEAYSNRSIVLKELNFLDQALVSCDKAIELNSNLDMAYNNRGNVLNELNRPDEALANYDKAIELNSNFAEVYSNRGNVLAELKSFDKAVESYAKALELSPDYEYLHGTLLFTKMLMCDWRNFEANLKDLTTRVKEGKKSSPSLAVLALTDLLPIQHKASEIWVNNKYPVNFSLGPILKSKPKDKIKIGYYSADFREHPVSYLMAEFFELHDKGKFELIAFYSGPSILSKMQERISSAFDKFIDIRLSDDKEVAKFSRDIEIDIAIDLTGITSNERIGIFSYRAAPLQIGYLGFAGTMGVEYYDYIIADKVVIPEGDIKHYVEKIIYLPNCYLPYDSTQKISDRKFTKLECNLPLDKFIFCCFNAAYKINPVIFASWMRILKATNDSVIWLSSQNDFVITNLKSEARKKGVDPNRLIFAEKTELIEEHLARHNLADLFLDTLPYNAHKTTLDALWAGLPVLTCLGESFASRVASSALTAIGLPELITSTLDQYEVTAIELAINHTKLKVIKDKLLRNRASTALFDTPLFTKHIEDALTQIFEIYQAELPPSHIYIES